MALSDDDLKQIGMAARLVRHMISEAGAGMSGTLMHRGEGMTGLDVQRLKLAREVLRTFHAATEPGAFAAGLTDDNGRRFIVSAIDAISAVVDTSSLDVGN